MVEAANQNVQADTVGQEETKVQQPSEEETEENALRDNIKRKGQNSVSLDLPTNIKEHFTLRTPGISLAEEFYACILLSRIFSRAYHLILVILVLLCPCE